MPKGIRNPICVVCGTPCFAESSYCHVCGESLKGSYKKWSRPAFSKRVLLALLCIWVVTQWASMSLLKDRIHDCHEKAMEFKQEVVDLEIKLDEKPKEILVRPDLTISVKDRMAQLQPKLDPVLMEGISEAIVKYSKIYQLSEVLVTNLIYRESAFNPMATSSAGAIGLMQVVPKYHKKLIEELDHSQLFHVDHNIRIGCVILKEYIKKEGTLTKALLKYVGGNNQSYVRDIFRLMSEHEVNKFSGSKNNGQRAN